jgi:molybdopterin converting factor small subunit
MEKKDEKRVVFEKKSTKKWKILINNEINYYETDDEKIKDIDVVELFMNKNSKK